MTIIEYVRLLRQHWLLGMLMTALATTASAGYSVAATRTYEAKAQIFVSAQASSGISDMTQASTFTQQRVRSYVDLASSPRLLQPVIDSLRLPTTAEALAPRVSASSPLDTVLINLTVTDSDPVRARDIANAVADAYPKLVAELETPPGEAKSPVNVSRTKAATTPTVPIAPRTRLNLLLGLLVGLGLGVGLAVLRESFDKTIKGRDLAQEVAAAPVMAAVGETPDLPDHALITDDAFSPRAEAFRQLRTNIRFLSVDQRVSSLVVTSAVAHEGKSTTASNLAIALAQAGESVVLIDADLRRPTIADVFALSSGAGLTSVLLGDLQVEEALQTWRADMPLRVLTAGPIPPNPAELIGSARMAALITGLTQQRITVVLDSPPLLPVTDAALLARATDGALIVTKAASTHTDQLAAACDALRIAGATVLGVVLNCVPRKRGSTYDGSYAYGGYRSYRSRKQPRVRSPFGPEPAEQATISARPAAPVQLPLAQSPALAVTMCEPNPDTRVVLPPPDELPDAVRAAISMAAPAPRSAPPTNAYLPVGTLRAHVNARARGRRAARNPHEPDLVIDADRGTVTRASGADVASWHVEWGDLPALIAGPREANGHNVVNGRVNGSSGRHRN